MHYKTYLLNECYHFPKDYYLYVDQGYPISATDVVGTIMFRRNWILYDTKDVLMLHTHLCVDEYSNKVKIKLPLLFL